MASADGEAEQAQWLGTICRRGMPAIGGRHGSRRIGRCATAAQAAPRTMTTRGADSVRTQRPVRALHSPLRIDLSAFILPLSYDGPDGLSISENTHGHFFPPPRNGHANNRPYLPHPDGEEPPQYPSLERTLEWSSALEGYWLDGHAQCSDACP